MPKQRQSSQAAGAARPVDGIKVDGDTRLSSSERRIIRNYRAMERIAQQTFQDMSEEFARTLPAPGRQGLRLAERQNLEVCQ